MTQPRAKAGQRGRTSETMAAAAGGRLDEPAAKPAATALQDWSAGAKREGWESILRDETLDVHFQPIISIRQKSIIGVEALARPSDGETGRPVTPMELFAWAARQGRTVDLDRLCRRKALSAYSPIADTPRSPLLFLNFESSVLDQGVLGSGQLAQAVRDAGLSPGQIVIEINESRVVDMQALRIFVEVHRAQGFLFALDDLGSGFSNLARIGPLKPEILKLDRSLVAGIEKDFHKQEVFRALVGLGRRVGSLVLAEGVETEEELQTCMDMGADLVQGFLFGRPASPDRISMDLIDFHVVQAAERQRRRDADGLRNRRKEELDRMRLMEGMAAAMSGLRPSAFTEALEELARGSGNIECLYVLDSAGLQATPTVTAPAREARARTRIFHPAAIGTDHASKEYFYALGEGSPRIHATDAYLSMASGRLCRTLSCVFADRDGARFMLCLDMLAA